MKSVNKFEIAAYLLSIVASLLTILVLYRA